MKFGFIGFGEVSYILSKLLLSGGFDVFTSIEGRSDKTKKLATSLDVTILDSFEDVAKKSDILISANSPQSALAIAVKYGSLTKGIFLDFNNISPITAKQIENYLGDDHFVDSAIMGKVSAENLNIFLSGRKSKELYDIILGKYSGVSEYNDTKINVKIVSDKIGDVSKLKILRSSFTKGISALLIETFETAEKLGLSDELWEVLALTENRDFKESSISRINNSYKSSKRKYEELNEVLDFLGDVDKHNKSKIMAIATKNKFYHLKND